MDLKDFIKESLLQLSLGIRDANDALASELNTQNRTYALRASKQDAGSVIDYDVAISLKEGAATEGGGGLKLAVADIGASSSKETTHETVSRMKFTVRIDWEIH